MRTADVVVLGAGLAGAATAHALAGAGVRSLIVLEREPRPGQHASGQSAGLIRRATEDPHVARLAREGADAIARFPVEFRRTGSLLAGAERRIPLPVQAASGSRWIEPAAAAARQPLLAHAALDRVLETPADGVVDVRRLLDYYLDSARAGGADVRFGVSAEQIIISGGRVTAVETRAGRIDCRDVVVAVGAWAARFSEFAGEPLPLVPRRRHLHYTECPGASAAASAPAGPWYWDLERGFYFRECEEGLLWSACDDEPGDPDHLEVDPRAADKLAARAGSLGFPARALDVRRSTAGHRTFTPDERFLLGPDPRVRGLHWAAALGGHGVTVSAAVGERVAKALLGARDAIEPEFRYADARFVRSAVAPPRTVAALLDTQLPVSVTLGTTEISLEQILSLSGGATFVLEGGAPRRIQLSAGGVPIGEGTLVQMGERLAIRLEGLRERRDILRELRFPGASRPPAEEGIDP